MLGRWMMESGIVDGVWWMLYCGMVHGGWWVVGSSLSMVDGVLWDGGWGILDGGWWEGGGRVDGWKEEFEWWMVYCGMVDGGKMDG